MPLTGIDGPGYDEARALSGGVHQPLVSCSDSRRVLSFFCSARRSLAFEVRRRWRLLIFILAIFTRQGGRSVKSWIPTCWVRRSPPDRRFSDGRSDPAFGPSH